MLRCQSCGEDNGDGARFCSACGARLEDSPAFEERKVVSVLFCDLVGFTARSDGADPEDVRAALGAYHARVRTLLEAHGGTVEKFIGDAVMAVFGARGIHEDDAERAVRAAFDVHRGIAELDRERDLDLVVRIGIATGEVVAVDGARPERGEMVIAGDTVNTAARLQTAAAPGAIVVGEATWRATRHVVEYEPLEPLAVKGKAVPLRAWSAHAMLTDDRAQPRDTSTPFIGRVDELEMLRLTLARALRERSIQLVTVLGEPGVGKTRLVQHFLDTAAADAELQVRRGRCLGYGDGVTFWAIRELVCAQAGITHDDGAADIRAKLEAAVVASVADPSEHEWVAGRLAVLLGQPATEPVSRDELFTAWRRFFEAVAESAPLVLVVEDLHWADPPLLEFLQYLAQWSSTVPLLMVVTARLELLEGAPTWGGGQRNAITIGLLGLSAAETDELLTVLVGSAALSAPVHRELVARIGGNPLYAQEFVQMLADRQRMDPTAGADAARDVQLNLPDTLQALLAARLDALPPDHKHFLQDASVVGMEFPTDAADAFAHRGADRLRDILHELTRREMVRPLRRTLGGHDEYAFTHVLLRDVAYSQLPRAARALRHEAVGRWFHSRPADTSREFVDVLAFHFHEALRLARAAGEAAMVERLRPETRRLLTDAGERVRHLDASAALGHFEAALALTSAEDAAHADLQVRVGEMLYALGRLDEATEVLAAAVVAFERDGRTLDAADAMLAELRVMNSSGDVGGARRLLDRAMTILEGTSPIGGAHVRAYTRRAGMRLMEGAHGECRAWAQRAIDGAASIGAVDLIPWPLSLRGSGRCLSGDPGGLDDLREALRQARELDLTQTAVNIYANMSGIVWVAETAEAGLSVAQAGIELADSCGITEGSAWIKATTGLSPLFDLGRWDDCVAAADEVLVWSRRHQTNYPATNAWLKRTEVLLSRGDLEGAAGSLDDYLHLAREIGHPQVLGPALTVAAQVAISVGDQVRLASLVDELLAPITRDGISWDDAIHLTELARVVGAAGRAPEFEARLATAPTVMLRHRNSALTARAVLAEQRGDSADALRDHLAAAESWREYGHVLEHGRALAGAARSARALGDEPTAAVLLGEAADILAGLGARLYLDGANPVEPALRTGSTSGR